MSLTCFACAGKQGWVGMHLPVIALSDHNLTPAPVSMHKGSGQSRESWLTQRISFLMQIAINIRRSEKRVKEQVLSFIHLFPCSKWVQERNVTNSPPAH